MRGRKASHVRTITQEPHPSSRRSHRASSTGGSDSRTCEGGRRHARRRSAKNRAQATHAAVEKQARAAARAEHARASGATPESDQPRAVPKQHTPSSSIEHERQRQQSMRGRAASHTRAISPYTPQGTHVAVEYRAQTTARAENARAGGVTHRGDKPRSAPKHHILPSSIEHERQRVQEYARASGVTHKASRQDRRRASSTSSSESKSIRGRAASHTRAISP